MGTFEQFVVDPLADVGPAVHHEVVLGEPAGLQDREVLEPLLLPARLERGEPIGVGRHVVADVDRARCALEHEQLAARPGEVWDALHRGRPRADDAHVPVGEVLHRRTRRVAAGVAVVPSAGVEAVPSERLDAGDARQLRAVQRPGAHRHELGTHLVAAVGADDPAARILVPLEPGHLGRQTGVLVQVEVLGDATAMIEDLRGVGVLLGGHVAGLFEQRQVDERGGVALGARISVPVPGAAEVAALLDDAYIVDAGLFQSGAGHQAGEPATDERNRHVVEQRVALDRRDVRVVQIRRELAGRLDVLLVAVGAQALVALFEVSGAQRVSVDPSRHAPIRSQTAIAVGASVRRRWLARRMSTAHRSS